MSKSIKKSIKSIDFDLARHELVFIINHRWNLFQNFHIFKSRWAYWEVNLVKKRIRTGEKETLHKIREQHTRENRHPVNIFVLNWFAETIFILPTTTSAAKQIASVYDSLNYSLSSECGPSPFDSYWFCQWLGFHKPEEVPLELASVYEIRVNGEINMNQIEKDDILMTRNNLTSWKS